MASISSIGIGSNLDLQSLLDKLQTNENTALDQINTQATSYQSQLSGYGTVKSVLDAYSAAAKTDRKSTRLNSSHVSESRMPSSA